MLKWLKEKNGGEGIVLEKDAYGDRFEDKYLVAFMIYVEFDVFPKKDGALFNNLLAAVYNQYIDPTFCNGNCNSVQKKLVWLSQKEGWYSTANPVELIGIRSMKYLSMSSQLIIGAYKSTRGEWEWGNYKPDSPLDKYINSSLGETGAYWWKGYGGTGEPYVGVDYKTFISHDYAGTVVFTKSQNLACNNAAKYWKQEYKDNYGVEKGPCKGR